MTRAQHTQAPVLIAISISSESRDELMYATEKHKIDLQYIAGNIELMVDDTFWTIGQFEGAVLLLPSLEVLAAGIRRFREGGTRYEVVLVGDVDSLWFARSRGHETNNIGFSYCGATTRSISMQDFENAVLATIREFFDAIKSEYPIRRWSEEELKIVRELGLTWPSLEVEWSQRRC